MFPECAGRSALEGGETVFPLAQNKVTVRAVVRVPAARRRGRPRPPAAMPCSSTGAHGLLGAWRPCALEQLRMLALNAVDQIVSLFLGGM